MGAGRLDIYPKDVCENFASNARGVTQSFARFSAGFLERFCQEFPAGEVSQGLLRMGSRRVSLKIFCLDFGLVFATYFLEKITPECL